MPSSTEPDPAAPAIAAEKYVSLTTFTKSGVPKPLPVWIAALPDGRIGFTTSADSWKAKRVRNTPKVTLQPCDQRGHIAHDAAEVTGTAEVVDGAQFNEIKRAIKAKYGMWVTVISAMNTVRGVFKREETQSNAAIIITLN
jgi:PPOX class probable F420-dependent enzyme